MSNSEQILDNKNPTTKVKEFFKEIQLYLINVILNYASMLNEKEYFREEN